MIFFLRDLELLSKATCAVGNRILGGAVAMMYSRYGKFRFGDYWGSWLAVIVYLAFAAMPVKLDISIWYCLVPAACAVARLWAIIAPNCERFTIGENAITVSKWGKKQEIALPTELTLVISYADIRPPLTPQPSGGGKTHILKDKYAVSVIRKMPLHCALVRLRGIYVQSAIQSVYTFFYSFVCSQTLLEKLLANRNCLLIVPESLSEKVSVDSDMANVYIDVGH